MLKILTVSINKGDLVVEGNSTFTKKGHHLIVWILKGKAAGTGGTLNHAWCKPKPPKGTFGRFTQVGILGFMTDRSQSEKKAYPYELTLTVGSTIYSTGACATGGHEGGPNPNIRNN